MTKTQGANLVFRRPIKDAPFHPDTLIPRQSMVYLGDELVMLDLDYEAGRLMEREDVDAVYSVRWE